MILTRKLEATASALVSARLRCEALDDFPGLVPDSLEDAYALQLAAIGLWPDDIAGWKVGRLSPDLTQRFGVDRFVGPVFSRDVRRVCSPSEVPFAMFPGGSAAFEAEFVIHVAGSAYDKERTSPAHMTIGIEVASSPVKNLPVLGSLASVADLGNNAGQLLGAAVMPDAGEAPETLTCATQIDAAPIVRSNAAALPGGAWAAYAFAERQVQALGFPLQAGQFVSTGAVTGMHAVAVGQRCSADFGEHGAIACRVTERQTSHMHHGR